MKKYIKPCVTVVDDLAEGVYCMGSGGGCYTVSAYLHQNNEIGRQDYRIQLDAEHNASHTNNRQVLTITFNHSVNYVSSNGNIISGNGTDTLVIEFGYWQNEIDTIGLGELIVNADEGLEVLSTQLTD